MCVSECLSDIDTRSAEEHRDKERAIVYNTSDVTFQMNLFSNLDAELR